MAKLKDSGERKVFENGGMREIFEGKGRCDLIPLDTIVYILDIDGEYSGEILMNIDKFLKTGDTLNLKKAIRIFKEQIDMGETEMMLELSIHYEDGARKYDDNNWRKGMPIHSFIDSGLRHYFKYLRGDTDEPHERAFLWNMVGAIWTMDNKPEFNDIYGYTGEATTES